MIVIGREAKPVLPSDGRVGPDGVPQLMGHGGPSQGRELAVNAAHVLWAAIPGRFSDSAFLLTAP